MRIGVDGRPLCGGGGYAGIYRFVTNLFREFQRIDSSNEYYVYTKNDFAFPLSNPRWRKRVLSDQRYGLTSRWGHLGLKHLIGLDALDVFLTTFHFFPIGLPPSLPRVLTVHDLVWHRHPETMGLRNYIMHRLFADRSISEADHIVTFSEATAADLEMLGVARGKISVVHHAPEAAYKPSEQAQAARYIAARYGASEDYICTVGTVEPRKNLVTLLKAISVLKKRARGCQLLVAGAPGWKNSIIYETVRECGLTRDDVLFLGYVPEKDMPALYCGSRLFVFPSVYEGFGIPLVEAMACGTPLVASNSSSIPEVVQDAALLVSPRSPEAFADAISRVDSDPELRSSMIAKGLRRAGDFSWECSAREVLNVLVGTAGREATANLRTSATVRSHG
jgi:glycosyltransferase involved in cell wall biosynthesis